MLLSAVMLADTDRTHCTGQPADWNTSEFYLLPWTPGRKYHNAGINSLLLPLQAQT